MSDLLPSPTWPPVAPPADGHLGGFTVSPTTPVPAGAPGTWTLTYTAGRFGVDDGGAVRIALHTSSDLGAPQFDDLAAPDYCAVTWAAPAPCRVEARYDADLGVRPWKRTIALRVRDQALRPGDTITVILGDRSGGSPGARAQTFTGLMRFHALVDAYGTGIFLPVAPPAAVPVVAGAAHHLRVHAPSDAAPGTPFTVTIVTLDQWGNATAHRTERAQLDTPGVHTVSVADAATSLRAESNPVRVHPPGEHPAGGLPPGGLLPREHPARGRAAGTDPAGAALGHRVLWGDLHAQSEETIGSGTLDDYFSHARDCAAIDFAGHQGNDFQVTEAVWRQIMAKTQEYDAASRFVTFAGYEWSGNTPGGGDHNVHFRGGPGQRYDLHRSGHWQIPDRADEATDRFPVDTLYAQFRGRDDVLLIPHVGGRYANVRQYFDESLMPLLEIASCWGVFEWFAGDALDAGHVFGFSAGSDDHTARPGMSHAPRGHFATGGGLTAVLARDHSRAAIWEALKARRTYATTGARLLLDVVARVGARAGRAARDYPMGSIIDLPALDHPAPGRLEIAVSVHGTAPLWRVEVLRWPDVVYRHALPASDMSLPIGDVPAGQHRLRIGWTGARIRARRRMTRWDGGLSVADGTLLRAEGWGFDHPEDGITARSPHSVTWRSETAGDWDGIVLELAAGDDAPLRFESGPATFSFTPRDIAAGPLVVDGGGVGQQVHVERDLGPQAPRQASFVYQLPLKASASGPSGPSAGRAAYFVRVTQQDGHVAWSSPFFVQR